MSVDIDIDFDMAKVQERLAAMELRSKDFSPVLRAARERLENANRLNFTSSGLPVGGWQRRRDDAAWPLMRKSGKLFNSLANLSGPPNRIYKRVAIFGTQVEYAKFHQYGTSKMPARKILFTPRFFGEEVSNDVIKYVSRGMF
jgi:phage gpG-like protein